MSNKEFKVRHGLIVGNTANTLVANTITGNVGIGTSDPQFALDVIGTINASSIIITAPPGFVANTPTVLASGNWGIGNTPFYFGTTDSLTLGGGTFGTRGELNLFNTDQVLSLDINGGNYYGPWIEAYYDTNYYIGGIYFIPNNPYYTQEWYANGQISLYGSTYEPSYGYYRMQLFVDPYSQMSTSGSIGFWSDQVGEIARVSNTGNILIGRTNSDVGQGVRLDVAGAINASAILVNGTPLEANLVPVYTYANTTFIANTNGIAIPQYVGVGDAAFYTSGGEGALSLGGANYNGKLGLITYFNTCSVAAPTMELYNNPSYTYIDFYVDESGQGLYTGGIYSYNPRQYNDALTIWAEGPLGLITEADYLNYPANDTRKTQIYLYPNTSGAALSNSRIVFSTDGTEKVTIDSSGNVGIRTSNPQYALDIVGDYYTSIANVALIHTGGVEYYTSIGQFAYGLYPYDSNGGLDCLILANANNFPGAGYLISGSVPTSYIEFNTTSSGGTARITTFYDNSLQLSAGNNIFTRTYQYTGLYINPSTEDLTSSGNNSYITFQTGSIQNGFTANVLYLDNYGNVYVGRGDSTVGQGVKLDVAGAINASAVLINGNPLEANLVPVYTYANTTFLANTPTVLATGNWGVGNTPYDMNSYYSGFTLGGAPSGGTGRLIYYSGITNQYVGGDWGGPTGMYVDGVPNYEIWAYDYNNYYQSAIIQLYGNTAAVDNSRIVFSTGDNYSERMRIDSLGNVLIGRTDSVVGQDVRLDINGAVNASVVFANGIPLLANTPTVLAVGHWGVGNTPTDTNPYYSGFTIGGPTTTGKIVYWSHINQQYIGGNWGGSTGMYVDGAPNYEMWAIDNNNYYQSAAIQLYGNTGPTDNSRIIFNTGDNYSERMRIDPSGNILINRTDSTVGQGVKLDIAGGANASILNLTDSLQFNSNQFRIGKTQTATSIDLFTNHAAGVAQLNYNNTNMMYVDSSAGGFNSGNIYFTMDSPNRYVSFDIYDPNISAWRTWKYEASGNLLINRTDSTVGQGVVLDVAGAINASAVLVNGSPITGGTSTYYTKIVTADYVVVSGSDNLIVTNSTGLINITLPNAVTSNAQTYTVKSINTGTVTILTSNTDLIDNSANLVIKTRYSAVNFISLGTSGWVVT